MAVSKRLRFEIFRRDNHICYYCGRKPPEVELTIDHVLPVALGGDDTATNLVTACTECNGGKTSIAPGSPLVARVDEDAVRWSAAMQAAIAKASTDQKAVATYREQFLEAWDGYRQGACLDENWRNSIETFRVRGLPIEILRDAVHRTMARDSIRRDTKFRYMCGIAWNKISEIEQEARRIVKAASTDKDNDGERHPSLAEELLPLIGQDAYESALADVRKYLDEDEDPSEERLQQDSIISAVYKIDSQRHWLTTVIQDLLDLQPANDVAAALKTAREFIAEMEPERNPSHEPPASLLWQHTAIAFIRARGASFMASLPEPEQEEWLRYYQSLSNGRSTAWSGWGEPSEEEKRVHAGKTALQVLGGWRFTAMCRFGGKHIIACPERGTARVACAGCSDCGIGPILAETGLLVCDAHLESAIEHGLLDAAGHLTPVTDFIALEPREPDEVPF